MTNYTIHVVGKPVPQPRPKVSTRGGFARAYYPPTVKPWKAAVIEQCHPHRPDRVIAGPVRVQLAFHLPRPKSMQRKSDPDGPVWHTKSNADADNLAKAVLDALTDDGWWSDDGQVVALEVLKFVAAKGDEPGCWVTISELPNLTEENPGGQ